MSHVKSQLTRFQPYTPWDDEQLRAKAKKLWQESGTVMVKPDWVADDFDRQHMLNIAEKHFGRRA